MRQYLTDYKHHNPFKNKYDDKEQEYEDYNSLSVLHEQIYLQTVAVQRKDAFTPAFLRGQCFVHIFT